ERWPRQRPVPHAEAWEVVPNLVVEVISPSDKGNDILDKVAEYFRIGVECIWVIFISQALVYIYESPTQVCILTRADELYGEPVLPHFRLPLATLFEDIEAAESPQQGRVPIFPVRLRAKPGVKWPYVSTGSTAPPCSTSARARWPRHWHDTRKCSLLSSAG